MLESKRRRDTGFLRTGRINLFKELLLLYRKSVQDLTEDSISGHVEVVSQWSDIQKVTSLRVVIDHRL